MEFYNNHIFNWDEDKAKNNVRKHRVSFYEAMTVFSSPSPLLTKNDDLHSQDEQRYKINGYSNKGRLLVVIVSCTDRGDVTRIISARKANRLERENYHEHFSEYLPFE